MATKKIRETISKRSIGKVPTGRKYNVEKPFVANGNKKLDVHLVPHTHWDREWYFTSDDSRTMLYFDMRYMIDHLENHDDVKFSYDGQSSVIDDFLKFSPDWKTRMSKVVKEKKLYVGPFYTQICNTIPKGEAIMRNLEVGIDVAKKLGHSMEVGYLPDTFGHNNQIPQILKMNGIDNISFYRGMDPEWSNDNLYFNYIGPDGTKILGHWQTHYTSDFKVFDYTWDKFEEGIMGDYNNPGEFFPSVQSYARRNYGLPIAYPIGTDQKPFEDRIVPLTKELNKKYPEYNFIVSDYETFLKDVQKQIKENKIELENVTQELRTAKTGRVHRSSASSRQDLKITNFRLENILINEIEPLAVMCDLNDIDVPWNMITHAWKELFKSSAHDSYTASNEDIINRKIFNRNMEAIRTLKGVSAMLSKIYAEKKLIEKGKDNYKKLVVFNTDVKSFTGDYEITFTVDDGKENLQFEILDGSTKVPFTVTSTDSLGTHERDAMKAILRIKNIPALGTKILKINYLDKPSHTYKKSKFIENDKYKLSFTKDKITLLDKKTKIKRDDFFVIAADPSVGDTYDHSPITHHDKKYIFKNYEVLRSIDHNGIPSIRVKASAVIPSGIDNWIKNIANVYQDIELTFILNPDNIRIKAMVKNNSLNARMIALVKTNDKVESWHHDQQYGVYKRNIKNEYMDNWTKRDKHGYLWDEYPTNLSSHINWISTLDNKVNVLTENTREHEVIDWEEVSAIAITMYRAFGKFGTENVLYRPGRASGAKCDAPDCQIIGKQLEFDFILSFDTLSIPSKFDLSRNFYERAFYIPEAWALDRTILRFKSELDYYDKSNKTNRKINLNLKAFSNKNLKQTALYRNTKGELVLRLLNVSGSDLPVDTSDYKYSLDNQKWRASSKPIEIPAWKLINIKLK